MLYAVLRIAHSIL